MLNHNWDCSNDLPIFKASTYKFLPESSFCSKWLERDELRGEISDSISGDALLNINAGAVDQVFRSEPTATGNGWRVQVEAGTGGGNAVTFQAVAICFNNP